MSNNLKEAILTRRAVRRFLPTPVPSLILTEALELAQHAPSGFNTQPWRLFLTSGAVKDCLIAALLEEVGRNGMRPLTALPPSLRHHRFEFGALYYGEALGIRRGDAEARLQANIRNFSFYGAPLGGVVCMPKGLKPSDTLSVGMWLQTLVLALRDRGVDSCPQEVIADYDDVLRRELGIPEDMEVMCGLAIGYADEDCRENSVRMGRDSIDCNVTFLSQ